MNKSIAFVHKDIHNFGYGGVSYLYQHLAEHFHRLGWKVFIVTRHDYKPKQKGIAVINAGTLADPFLHSKRVSRIIRKLNPAIAECSNWKFELLDYARQTSKSTKVVVRCDPSAVTLFGDRTLTIHEADLARAADLVTAVSVFAKNDIVRRYGISQENVRVSYNGIDAKGYINPRLKRILTSGSVSYNERNFMPIANGTRMTSLCPPSPITVFWCGKMNKMKGFDILQKIIQVAPQTFHFVINLGHSLPHVKWNLAPNERVVFLQDLSKADQLSIMKQCSLYLSTSRVEGFCLNVVEALALKQKVAALEECRVFDEFSSFFPMSRLPSDPKKIVRALTRLARSEVAFKPFPKEFTMNHLSEQLSNMYLRLLV